MRFRVITLSQHEANLLGLACWEDGNPLVVDMGKVGDMGLDANGVFFSSNTKWGQIGTPLPLLIPSQSLAWAYIRELERMTEEELVYYFQGYLMKD